MGITVLILLYLQTVMSAFEVCTYLVILPECLDVHIYVLLHGWIEWKIQKLFYSDI